MHKYPDAKHMDIKPKVAVVIASFIPANQKGEDKLVSIKLNLAAHKHFDAGLEYDLYVIDCGSTSVEGVKFLEEMNSTKRENEGFSFGAWKWAWGQLKDRGYMFFLFCEDDMAPTEDGWLKDLTTKFFSEPNIGVVGSTVECHSRGAHPFTAEMCDIRGRDELFTVDGCFTFTSADILRQVDLIGGLDVAPTGTDHDLGVRNEVMFQQQILELGYTITGYNDGEHLVIHGSEVATNDLTYRTGPPEPLININARHKVPEVGEIYSWYEKNSPYPITKHI